MLYTNPLAFNPAKPVFVAAEKRSPVRIQPVNVFDGESLKVTRLMPLPFPAMVPEDQPKEYRTDPGDS